MVLMALRTNTLSSAIRIEWRIRFLSVLCRWARRATLMRGYEKGDSNLTVLSGKHNTADTVRLRTSGDAILPDFVARPGVIPSAGSKQGRVKAISSSIFPP